MTGEVGEQDRKRPVLHEFVDAVHDSNAQLGRGRTLRLGDDETFHALGD